MIVGTWDAGLNDFFLFLLILKFQNQKHLADSWIYTLIRNKRKLNTASPHGRQVLALLFLLPSVFKLTSSGINSLKCKQGRVTCGHLPFDCARLLISSTVLLRESWSDRDTKTGRMYLIRAEREGKVSCGDTPLLLSRTETPRSSRGCTMGWVGVHDWAQGNRETTKASGKLRGQHEASVTTLSVHRRLIREQRAPVTVNKEGYEGHGLKKSHRTQDTWLLLWGELCPSKT